MRYMTEFEQAVEQLGIRPRYVRQSRAYRDGLYVDQIRIAMEKRFEIFNIFAEYQILEQHAKSVEERRPSISRSVSTASAAERTKRGSSIMTRRH